MFAEMQYVDMAAPVEKLYQECEKCKCISLNMAIQCHGLLLSSNFECGMFSLVRYAA